MVVDLLDVLVVLFEVPHMCQQCSILMKFGSFELLKQLGPPNLLFGSILCDVVVPFLH